MIQLLLATSFFKDVNKAAEIICKAFETHGQILDLIKFMAKWEIAKTKQYTTLFRANTLTTKLMTCWSKQEGSEYLSSILGPFVNQITSGALGSLEVYSFPAFLSFYYYLLFLP